MNESWGRRNRESVLLLLGGGILVVVTVAWAISGREPDKLLVGAALAILGIIPVIQQNGNGGGK